MFTTINPLIACGGKFVYYGTSVSASASRSFVYDPVANTFRQEFSTRGAGNDTPGYAYCYNNRYIYFKSNNSNGRTKKFKYDTQTKAITQITNLLSDQNLSELTGDIREIAGKLYFWSTNAGGFLKLTQVDPSFDNATQISNLTANAGSSDSVANGSLNFISAGGRNFLANYTALGGGELYEFNPAGPTFTLLSNTDSGGSDNIGALQYFGDSLYFVANIANSVSKLMRFKLTSSTLYQISNTAQNQSVTDGASALSGPQILAYFNNKLYFSSKYAAGYMKMFSYNPSNDAVTQISNFLGNTISDMISFATALNGKLYFVANNTNSQAKLFRMNNSEQIEQISNTTGNQSTHDSPQNLTVYNNRLYFTSKNSQGMYKLMVYDEPTNSIVTISNTNQNVSFADSVGGIFVNSGLMTFIAETPTSQPGVFALCDTSAGCSLP